MGQAGSSQRSSDGGYGFTPGQLGWDEYIARHLQEEEFIGNSVQLDAIDERELQIARDAELAFYMDANEGALPPEFGTNAVSGEYHGKEYGILTTTKRPSLNGQLQPLPTPEKDLLHV